MSIKTPCIGVCSTTSLGDAVCRGCKRYAFEVIHWNSYAPEAKASVLNRIEKLVTQILENKLQIFSETDLMRGLEQARVPFDQNLSPWCWLHNLLRKHHEQITDLNEYGACVLPKFSHLTLAQLSGQIEKELLVLCEAHLDRYYKLPSDPCNGGTG
ncbi:MAG: DUF1289 domain-containing protein [Gammaproteobacteria bacterium]|nr:DUF1289 domain-containing protein [Gammaproteobacteria bacterium]